MYSALILADAAGKDAGSGTGGTDDGEGSTPPPASPLGGMGFLIPFILILLLMYFIMLRPQRKQQKRRQEMLAQMEKNDRVVTIGGIFGTIYSVGDNEVVLKVDERNDVRIRMAKSAINHIVTDDEQTPTS